MFETLEARTLFSVPVISQQPTSNAFVTEGQSMTLMAAATGDPAPTVQWEVSLDGVTDFTPITNNASATTPTLVVPNVPLGAEFNQYEAIFTNSDGTATTDTVTLYVEQPTPVAPTVTQQPTDVQLAAAGDNATFTAAAAATPNASVQWYQKAPGATDFSVIPDNSSATTTTLQLSNASSSMSGYQYEAIFTNSAGNAVTSAATLTVPPSSSVSNPAPTAAVIAPAFRRAAKWYSFTVTYTGNSPIDTSTIDAHNMVITGPNGFAESVRVSTIAPSKNGRAVTVTYRVNAAHWTSSNNGEYHVYLRSYQVQDAIGTAVAGGILAPFKVLMA
jgi:hypothetical protein